MILSVSSVSTSFESEVKNCKEISPIAPASFSWATSSAERISCLVRKEVSKVPIPVMMISGFSARLRVD